MNKAKSGDEVTKDCFKLSSITIILLFLVSLSSFVIVANHNVALAFTPNPFPPANNSTGLAETGPSFLKVFVRVDNTGGGTAKPSDFDVVMYGDTSASPGTFDGSENGTIVAMSLPGTYRLAIIQDSSVTTAYGKSFSGECKLAPFGIIDAEGTINSGDKKTCIVTMIFPGF